MTLALLFPGQGSQHIGMGKELAEAFPAARAVFEEVDDALSQPLSALMFEGPAEELTLTENAQPAIMAVSMAVLRVLEEEAGFCLQDQAAYVAGHSLGEYSALAAAGSLSLTDTARLLRIRGQAMQASVPVGRGTMAALLGIDHAAAQTIAEEAAQGEICSVANDNAPGQVVVSGAASAVERAMAIAKEKGAKRAVLLPVSAPFHCTLMAPAAGVMDEALSLVRIAAPAVPLISNITAEAVASPEYIRQLLVDQVTGMVRWRESIAYLQRKGVSRFIELGAGKVLSGLNKRISPEAESVSIGLPQEIQISFFAKQAA